MDRYGNLDNSPIPRWIVTLDALLIEGAGVPKKKVFETWEKMALRTEVSPLALNRIWRTSMSGIRFECAIFGRSHDYAELMLEHLDRVGASACAWVVDYPDRDTLRSALAFRPDVQAVVDLPEDTLFWGSRGIAIGEL